MTRFHLHLVSDSTGETVHGVAKACVAQFEGCEAIEHVWSLVRSRIQLERVLMEIAKYPGMVLFSLVNDNLRGLLRDGCRQLNVPAIPVLDPVIGALAGFLGRTPQGLPGQQHALDHEYFARIDAMTYALSHDDGQGLWGLNEADVILVGVSRTSKTPTSIYLANRGIKTANIPWVTGAPLAPELLAARKPLIIGLTNDPDRLVAIRKMRIGLLDPHTAASAYVDLDAVRAEVVAARRLFIEHRWPIIDVARRSIEETAASIIQLLAKRQSLPQNRGAATI